MYLHCICSQKPKRSLLFKIYKDRSCLSDSCGLLKPRYFVDTRSTPAYRNERNCHRQTTTQMIALMLRHLCVFLGRTKNSQEIYAFSSKGDRKSSVKNRENEATENSPEAHIIRLSLPSVMRYLIISIKME